MVKKRFGFILFAIFWMSVYSGCKKNNKDDPRPENPVNEEGGDSENITRIELYLTDSANINEAFTIKYTNPDQLGTTGFAGDSIKLKSGKTYLGKVFIFDDTKKPADTVSNEIREEANYHRFHYSFTPSSGSTASMQILITDQDTQSPAQPLGLLFKWKTGAGTGNGRYNLMLRHFANGQPKSEDIRGGESDLSAEFPVRITQ